MFSGLLLSGFEFLIAIVGFLILFTAFRVNDSLQRKQEEAKYNQLNIQYEQLKRELVDASNINRQIVKECSVKTEEHYHKQILERDEQIAELGRTLYDSDKRLKKEIDDLYVRLNEETQFHVYMFTRENDDFTLPKKIIIIAEDSADALNEISSTFLINGKNDRQLIESYYRWKEIKRDSTVIIAQEQEEIL